MGCHGGVKKAGDVSLIYREEALGKGEGGKGEGGKYIIVAGKPMESDLYLRIISKDPEVVMPKVEKGGHAKPLNRLGLK